MNSRSSNNVFSGPADSNQEAPAIDSGLAQEVTTINIDSDSEPSTASNTQHQDSSTRINMENSNGARLPNSRNLLLLFNEARSQLGRQSAQQEQPIQQQHGAADRRILLDQEEVDTAQGMYERDAVPNSPSSHGRHARSWRMNLNDVLSFSSAPTTEALRSFITHSSSFRYTPLNTSESAAAAGDNIHLLLNQQGTRSLSMPAGDGYRMTTRSNSLHEPTNGDIQQHGGANSLMSSAGGSTAAATPPPMSPLSLLGISSANRQNNNGNASRGAAANRNAVPQPNTVGAEDMDEDNNVISDIFVKLLSHFVRYLPFICILFVKFIHDHLLGILDLLLLHGIMYQINKSLREQIAKFSQKSYGILLRDFSLVAFVVAYRFVLASSTPDPFGLLISPPANSVTIEVSSLSKSIGNPAATASGDQQLPLSPAEVLGNYLSQLTAKVKPATSSTATDALGNAVTITKAVSLGVLLYYVAVNDLILKLITILVKISITLMPTRIIRHKPRARMFVLVEYLSQFYRALAPVRQWLLFLFESYSGLEVISGILFSSFYMGAKGFEFVERGKSLKKALINFLRNMDYERKPTKEELDAAGSLCPICHDAYNTPVVLECGHIFCDDCVSTWFKREQTCPMCRAKVSEDPTWQDGSTTFFYQLC